MSQPNPIERHPKWQAAWSALDLVENTAKGLGKLLPDGQVGAIIMRATFAARQRLIQGGGGLGDDDQK